jgi:hypothetical protein
MATIRLPAISTRPAMRGIPDTVREHTGDGGIHRTHQPAHRGRKPRQPEQRGLDENAERDQQHHAPPPMSLGLSQ